MGAFINKYKYIRKGDDLGIYEETKHGVSRKIAYVSNCVDKFEIARNLVTALNSRHNYLIKKQEEKQ